MSIESSTQDSALLLTLEEISQLVSHSHDPGETLTNIVRLIQGRCETDVCSVYLLEPERGELVLGATVGLEPSSVGRIRMRIDEGLTGLVAERMAPVMVDDAFQHPRFKYFPEAGEDPYHSFLGVPLVEAGAVQGVLVVQTLDPRAFSSGEARMLVTVAAQIAPLVSGRGCWNRSWPPHTTPESRPSRPASRRGRQLLRGLGLSPGLGLGHAYVVNGADDGHDVLERRSSEPSRKRIGSTSHREAVHDEITRLSRRVSELVGEDHGAILQAQLMILQDRTIEADLAACLTAALGRGALGQTLNKYVAVFRKLTNPLFQERVFDIKDVFRRILWQLRPHVHATDAGGDRLVLVAHEASVMDLFSVDLDRLAAVVVGHGGPQSHAAILARSLGIPMVGQLLEGAEAIRPGQLLLVDGSSGLVQLDPMPKPVETQPTPTRCATAAEPPRRWRLAGPSPGRGEHQPAPRGRAGRRASRRGGRALSDRVPLPRPADLADRGGAGRDLPEAPQGARGPSRDHPDVRPPPGQGGPLRAVHRECRLSVRLAARARLAAAPGAVQGPGPARSSARRRPARRGSSFPS